VRRRIAFAAACAAWGSGGLVHAQDDKPELHFSADEVEGDVRMGELVLRGNVVVTYERFRLTSPELSLRRTGRGIEVRGPGEVVFCPCPDPPLTIAFEGGVVGPPADLVLQHPQLRVGGTTMFGLPWFWLRAPSRPGILPPNIAWRGGDGLLAGGGVHLPWKDGAEYDELDLTAAGYLKGGVELTARLRTPRSTNRVRWDHLHQDLFAVDAHGSYPQTDTGMMAWDLDAVRGPRARSATLNLDDAARAYDRGAAEVMVRPIDGVIFGGGVRGVGSRGGGGGGGGGSAPSERPAWGPRASLGFGGALGSVGAWDELMSLTTLHDTVLGPLNLLRTEGGAEVAARPAFFVTRLGVREAFTVADSAATSGLDAIGTARLEVAAPFVHAFPSEDAPLVHVIEPRLRGALVSARTSGAYWSSTGRPVPLITGEIATASAGLRTAWGRLLGHSGASVEADAGAVGLVESGKISEAVPVGRYRAAWSSRYFGVGAEGGARLRGALGQVVVGRTRLGEQDGWHVQVKAAGREGVEPLFARVLAAPSAEEPSGGWLSDEGWSGAAEIAGRLTRSVSARVSADEDLTSRTMLQVRGSIGYAHPCRCVSVDGFASKRLGREGVDVWISIDLAPR
jgi:hypothetical protein